VVSETLRQVGTLVATVGGLWVGARLLVGAAVRLARRVGLSDLTIGLTIVAAGTSTPELVVTTDAALKGLGEIAVGNVLGSNVYNLAFVLGVVSLVRVIPVERSLVHRDGVALVASALLAGAVLLDGTVSRVEGAALLGTYVLYTAYLLRTGGEPATADPGADDAEATADTGSDGTVAGTGTTTASDPSGTAVAGGSGGRGPFPGLVRTLAGRVEVPSRDPLALVVGLAVVLVSGDLLVGAATGLARGAGVSEWVIGGTIVAAGTSTPEFAVSLVAMRSGRLGVSVGNVVGSNVYNVLAVLGLGAALAPLSVGPDALETTAWLLVVSVLMVAALWSGRKLSRPEGGLFALSEVVRWVLGLLPG
jgi:cation:H+ antiporter